MMNRQKQLNNKQNTNLNVMRVILLALVAVSFISCSKSELAPNDPIDPIVISGNGSNSGGPVGGFFWTNSTIIYDVNQDGSVNLKDVMDIKQWLADNGAKIIGSEQPSQGMSPDVNGDGFVDYRDAKWVEYVVDANNRANGWIVTERIIPNTNANTQTTISTWLDALHDFECITAPENLGQSEKWFSSASGKNYYILPNGQLFRRDPGEFSDKFIHRFGSGYHNNENLVCDAARF